MIPPIFGPNPLSTVTDSTSIDLSVSPGRPFPLGATPEEDGSVNFSISSQYGTRVLLCLFTDIEHPWRETHRIDLDGNHLDTWSIRVGGIPAGATYGYRIEGPWEPEKGHFFNENKLLLDPYARHIPAPSRYVPSMRSLRSSRKKVDADSGPHAPRSRVPLSSSYDWEGDRPLDLPMEESVFCELHVKGFTRTHPGIPEELRGTYAGLAHEASIAYLTDLGITTVQLLPVHHHLDDSFLLEKGLVNYWGYNTIGFFAPEARYAASEDPISEFRDMVKALHRAGIEVILDVVYNHTGEAGLEGPTCLFRGSDNLCYYHTEPLHPSTYRDFTGCGNSVDVSHPRSLRFVMDSLRYWAEEMHVDGFRFDLAVELGRETEKFRRRAAFFKAIQQDPVLSQRKMIAEPWDLGPHGYQLGNFPTNWSELNGKFRDDVRQFWRGDPGTMGNFASRITGSEGLFSHNRRCAGASVNLITSHDGFPLNDLVSYNDKHNLANGEGNRDGDSHNLSWNHGVEGPTDDPGIRSLRLRQVRNFLVTLFCSQGVPFLLSGDERLRSQGGNNNAYCQDNEISWIPWDDDEDATAMREFTKRLIQFRRDHPELRRSQFFTGKTSESTGLPDVCWLRPDGEIHESADWNGKKAGAFAMLIHGDGAHSPLLFFFNARDEKVKFHFPKAPVKKWELLIDTEDPARSGSHGRHGSSNRLVEKSSQIWIEA